jgi:diguanylate cyclase (GGDEF)-like protein
MTTAPSRRSATKQSVGLAGSPRVTAAIAASYVIDAALLLGFGLAGTIHRSLSLLYLVVGLSECLLFRAWINSSAIHGNLSNDRCVLVRTMGCAVIQLSFMIAAPQVAFYFLTVLFIVVGLGSMSVSTAAAASIWLAVAAVSGVLCWHAQGDNWVPQRTLHERLLVWACLITILGRCTLLGVFSRSLRQRLQQRGAQLRHSISELKARDQSLEQANAELHYQATHDALTGLANRTLFEERLRQAVREELPFAVAVLDLDRFKIINDSLGHGAGDLLLQLVARRLQSSTRADDLVARAGGDEFLLLLPEVESQPQLAALASRWTAALSEPYGIRNTELHVSPSIGIARYPADAVDGQELVARADEAMYHAKQSGRNAYRFFDSQVSSFTRGRLTMAGELRQAITQGQLELLYQPKIDVASGEMHSVEALLRWQHPARGCVLPGEFMPVAEDSGFSHEIGDWVLDQACRQAKLWQDQSLPFVRIAVNISPTQFRHPDFAIRVQAALTRHALHPSSLEVEISESALMGNAQKAALPLEQLSRIGVAVAVDDFGTGYSNMSYLQRFPIDKLKIDGAFVRHLQSDSNDASIVRAIISLAHGLRLKVVAEGVETPGQLSILKRMGCDQYQGFLHSPAVPAEEIEFLLASERALAANDGLVDATVSRLARLVRPGS